jgi:hypothetical protein
MSAHARQFAAAARQYDNACDCCDHAHLPEPEPDPIEPEPYRDRCREWAGVESSSGLAERNASERARLARLWGDEFFQEMPF